MSKYIDADQIRAEIKRLDKHYLVREYDDGWNNALNAISKFLDSLPEQPVEGLEEEVKRYYSENFAYITSDQPTLSILTNIARHFAGMMPTLKKILLLKEEERRDEQAFKTLLADTILKETGKTVSDERLDAAIEWWKTKVIYSRPLRSDDAKAFRMIKGRVLNKKIE